ncbi:hypothetical protein BHM03_00005434 [Ensete ventricosum]|nr:hypothetical protein BHM03_00005434 [Ensete ventricosum]
MVHHHALKVNGSSNVLLESHTSSPPSCNCCRRWRYYVFLDLLLFSLVATHRVLRSETGRSPALGGIYASHPFRTPNPQNRFLNANGFRQYALGFLGLRQAGEGEWMHVASIRCPLGHSQPFIALSLLYSSSVASLPCSAAFRPSQIFPARMFFSFLASFMLSTI